MTTSTQVGTRTGERARDRSPVVVAVDGSDRNKAAVAWAATEAARLGTRLVLVTVVDDAVLPLPHFSVRGTEQQARSMLDAVAAEVGPVVGPENLDSQVLSGWPAEVLVSRFPEARLLVVGKRGLGAIPRLIVGSTSLAVAGRARVPVVVVPDEWHQVDHDHRPIVVGVDPYRPYERVVDVAIERAARFEVPLVAVHGWEIPTAGAWGATSMAGAATPAVAEWEEQAHDEFDRVLNAWRGRHPEVELSGVRSHLQPAMAVLDAAEKAQLVVLGRHVSHRLGGFAFGSVTRAVLHYAECPVLVVPTDNDA